MSSRPNFNTNLKSAADAILFPPSDTLISSIPDGPSLYAISSEVRDKIVATIKRSGRLKALAAERAKEIEAAEASWVPRVLIVDGDIARRDTIVSLIKNAYADEAVVITTSDRNRLRGATLSGFCLDDLVGGTFSGLVTDPAVKNHDWSHPNADIIGDLTKAFNSLSVSARKIEAPTFILSAKMVSRCNDALIELGFAGDNITILPEDFSRMRPLFDQDDHTEPHWVKNKHGRNRAPNTSKHNKRNRRCK